MSILIKSKIISKFPDDLIFLNNSHRVQNITIDDEQVYPEKKNGLLYYKAPSRKLFTSHSVCEGKYDIEFVGVHHHRKENYTCLCFPIRRRFGLIRHYGSGKEEHVYDYYATRVYYYALSEDDGEFYFISDDTDVFTKFLDQKNFRAEVFGENFPRGKVFTLSDEVLCLNGYYWNNSLDETYGKAKYSVDYCPSNLIEAGKQNGDFLGTSELSGNFNGTDDGLSGIIGELRQKVAENYNVLLQNAPEEDYVTTLWNYG